MLLHVCHAWMRFTAEHLLAVCNFRALCSDATHLHACRQAIIAHVTHTHTHTHSSHALQHLLLVFLAQLLLLATASVCNHVMVACA